LKAGDGAPTGRDEAVKWALAVTALLREWRHGDKAALVPMIPPLMAFRVALLLLTLSCIVTSPLHGQGRPEAVVLAAMFVPLPPGASVPEIVATLKRRVPALRYEPGIHDPLVSETANAKPFYRLPGEQLQGVIVSVEGLWISHGCWD
jgi:hypothetical protein